ncbi:putative S-locus glycoprotein [Helianthus anomalus]
MISLGHTMASLLLLLAFSFLRFIHTRVDVASSQSISLGHSIVAGAQSSDAWYSQSELFAFGFYPQGTGYVVAIWLVIDEENPVVWTAYRDDPPVSPNSTLELTHKGELVLFSDEGVMRYLYTDYFYPAIRRVTLCDDGIFRLYSYNHTNSTHFVVWEVPRQHCDVKNFCGINSYCTMNDEQPYCACLPGSEYIDPNQKYSGCQRNFTKAICVNGKENMTYYNETVGK